MLSDEEIDDLHKFIFPWNEADLTKEQLAVIILDAQAEERRIQTICYEIESEKQSIERLLKETIADHNLVRNRLVTIRETLEKYMKRYEEKK